MKSALLTCAEVNVVLEAIETHRNELRHMLTQPPYADVPTQQLIGHMIGDLNSAERKLKAT